jgi:UDP-glucose 4-epimerase
VLRYFNVAGADPRLRTGQSTPAATRLSKAEVETALGIRHRLPDLGRHLYPRLYPARMWTRSPICAAAPAR